MKESENKSGNERNGLPASIWIREDLRKAILTKRWGDTDKIPKESELAATYGASRSTVAKSVNALVAEGLLFRIRGTGTFIARDEPPAPPQTNDGFSQKSSPSRPSIVTVLYNDFVELASSPLHLAIVEGVKATLSSSRPNVQLQLISVADDSVFHEKNKLIFDMLESGGVAGIITLLTLKGRDFDFFSELDIPVVKINSPAYGENTYSVSADYHSGACQAVREFFNAGHEKIGFVAVAGKTLSTYQEMSLRGYSQAMEAFNLKESYSPMFFHRPPENNDYFDEVLPQLKAHTALYASYHFLGAQIIKQLARHDIAVPKDMSVIACRHHVSAKECEEAGVTTIDYDFETIGRRAAEIIIKTMDGETTFPQNIYVETSLTMRKSSGPACRRAQNQTTPTGEER